VIIFKNLIQNRMLYIALICYTPMITYVKNVLSAVKVIKSNKILKTKKILKFKKILKSYKIFKSNKIPIIRDDYVRIMAALVNFFAVYFHHLFVCIIYFLESLHLL
jgi:hypothetical protein